MSTKITYNSTTTEVANGKIATLSCNGKKMKSDIVVEVPSAEDSAIPIEVSTEADMTALLESGEVGGVYKYTGTTGTYENGALYVLENATITFTIDGTEYQAEDGMTWGEWVASEYNTASAYLSSDGYIILNSKYIATSSYDRILSTANIVSGYAYVLAATGSGGAGN